MHAVRVRLGRADALTILGRGRLGLKSTLAMRLLLLLLSVLTLPRLGWKNCTKGQNAISFPFYYLRTALTD